MPKNTPKTRKRKKSAKEKAAYIVAAGAIIAAILGMVRFQVTFDKKPDTAPVPLKPDTVIVTENPNPDPPKFHSFRGYVFDCFGYAVSGVEVKVVHTGGAIIHNFKTDNMGEWVIKITTEVGFELGRQNFNITK